MDTLGQFLYKASLGQSHEFYPIENGNQIISPSETY